MQRRGTTARNLSSVHVPRSSFYRAELPRSQTPRARIQVLSSSSCSSFQLSTQGDSEEVCELEIEGTGLVQIFRVGEKFAGRIVERKGPFSKTTTVPLFCKGFSDPEEATRRLARLPRSAARRRIHILSDPTRGTERFIFLGDLGLRGGGDGEPSSSSNALGHQTPAEGSTSRSVIQRALTPVDRFLVQRIFDEGSPYQNLEQVVKAFNEADDAVLRLAPAVVIRRVLCAFKDMHAGEATDNGGAVVRECLALCCLDSGNREHVPLLKDFFGSVRDKLCTDAPNNRYLTEAIELTLQTVEAELFEDDPGCLVRLANFLLDELDPEKASFSRKTFPAQCSALHAVHECLRILGDVGLDDLDPDDPEGLHAKFEDCCRKVIDVARYYPMKYEAMLVRHSLTSSKFSKRGAHNASNAKRVVGLLYGTAGIHQAVRKAVHLDFDLGNAESVARALQQVRLQAMVQAMHQARRGEVVWEDQWRTCLHALNTGHFTVMEDPSAFEVFSEILSSLVLEGRASDSEHCKVLRFGVVEMLTMLSIHAKDGDVRRASAETLASLVELTDEWDWSSDPDLCSELLGNLAELCARGFENEKRAANDAIEKLLSNVHNPACEEAQSDWRREKKEEEEIDLVSSGEDKTSGNELFLRVWKGLEDELSAPTTEDRLQTKKKHSLASPDIVRYFAGRKDELSEIVEAFTASAESVVAKVVAGPGGIGKTQLAIKAFDHFRSKHSYDDEFWISSGSRESITAAFLQIAECLQIPTDDDTPELVRRVREKLGRSRCLYVFDDAPNLELIREYVPSAGAHVIVTTRECGASEWESSAIRLEPLDEVEALILAKKFECAKSLRSKDLDDLMDLLPRTPLALAQFFSVMRDEDVWKPGEWVQRMLRYKLTPEEAETIAKLSATRSGEVATGMVFVFNSSVRKISKEPNDLGPRSLDLLAKLALLDPNGVPVDWVYKWHEFEDEPSRTKTENSIKLLERFSHVSWDKKTNQIHMHAETQLLVKQLLINIDESSSSQTQQSEEQKRNTIRDHVDTIVDSIGRYIGEWRTDRSNRELWTSLARNGLPLLESCEKCKEHRAELKLLEHMSEAYKEMCMFQESISYAHSALKMCERLHGDSDHPDLVIRINNYASGLQDAGRINEALPLYKRALEMCERLYGDADHPDVLRCVNNYAAGHKVAGRNNEALPLFKRALEMCERLYGDADHPDVLRCVNNYALGHKVAGRNNEALPLLKRALEMCERLYGDADHPDLVLSIGNIAEVLKDAGRNNEALPLFKRALEMCERLYGDADHPDVLRCVNNYALGHKVAGRNNEALPLFKRALEMCERLYGDADHPDVLRCVNNYALGHKVAGRNNEALPLFKRALEMCERLYGDADHPDLVLSIGNYAEVLKVAGRNNEALPLFKRALEMCERLYGDADHPSLVLSIGNYAEVLKVAGRNNEALPLFKRALEMCERLYGDADHPDLVLSIGNIAEVLKDAGRNNEALPLFKRALEMCERLYGDADHPDVLRCVNNYALGHRVAGRNNEALPLFKRALEMCERLYGDADHPDLVLSIGNIAVVLKDAGRNNEALPLFKRALEMCERLYGDADHPDVLRCVNNYALGHKVAGRNNEALPLFKRALEMCERLYGDADHPDLVLSIGNIAEVLKDAGRNNEALPLFKRALEMCERLYGDADHPDVLRCVNNYALGHKVAGRNNEALPLLKRALEMCERLYGDADHPDLVLSIGNIAEVLIYAGRIDEALPLFKRALEMCERLYGDADHPDVLRCVNNYAAGHKVADRNNEALPLFKRALEMCERLYGDADHPSLVLSIGNYAEVLIDAGRIDEALPLFKRALEMCERLYGDADHPDVLRCVNNYALGHKVAGRNNEALPLFKRALEMCERLYGDADHPDLVLSIGNYAEVLKDAGRNNEALPLFKRALEMCERLYGDADHPSVVTAIGNYALCVQDTGRIDEALQLYKRALEMCERLHGDADHPNVVLYINNYAAVLKDAGRIDEALPLFKRALEMCERLYGDADHPDLVCCMRNYANCLVGIGRDNEALPYLKGADEMLERLGDS